MSRKLSHFNSFRVVLDQFLQVRCNSGRITNGYNESILSIQHTLDDGSWSVEMIGSPAAMVSTTTQGDLPALSAER